jgi:hypothetical protein
LVPVGGGQLISGVLGERVRVEFELESGLKGPRTAQITVTPLETPPGSSFEELAAYFHRHAASYIHDLTHLRRRWLMHVPQWLKPGF